MRGARAACDEMMAGTVMRSTMATTAAGKVSVSRNSVEIALTKPGHSVLLVSHYPFTVTGHSLVVMHVDIALTKPGH